MLRGFYTATAGMLAQQRRTEMLSNNIANANTPGYKSDQASLKAFPEMLLQRVESSKVPAPASPTVGTLNTGVYLQEMIPQFTQGDLRETGLSSDVALVEELVPYNAETNAKGALLFAVQTQANEVRYTRNGQFTRNENGELTLAGNPVLGTNGQPISLASDQFEITPDGTVRVDGAVQAQIEIVFAGDTRTLIKEGNGLFRSDEELQTAVGNPDISYQLKQGYVEGSNVDVSKSYTEMMTAYRAFEANQKVLQAYDRSMDKAVNEIGRVR
ncbi:flagellar hook-basal body protein [Peribacillus frigoritolerans]|uniref:flagellar hook-basal body protein n=1 Tax=Peribacillus frigoritolerans TaxID=450367 RepID=UPI001059C914|nr:flagellar hook-basal body protein [Peribacillus frigoritolerans]TDL79016.1 flagellar hook-basal body protein [Peribacillus frigoritolerans]